VNISNGGTVTAITRTAGGTGYTSSPTVAISAPTTAGGVQATATVAVSAGAITTFTITNAGSGYVEQPTVTFSGGGGSNAAAYATVGSGTTIRSLGTNLSFFTPGGEQVRIVDNAVSSPSLTLTRDAANRTQIRGSGNLGLFASVGGAVGLYTNTAGDVLQLNVAHTASAVNYVQVTGAATGNKTEITAQGSDAAVGILYKTKSLGFHEFQVNQRRVLQLGYSTGTDVNYINLLSAAAGASPTFSSAGSDTNIDLALTPKGTGLVRFGTYTAGALSIAGYIEIKDAGGTTRRLAVVA
jgi:hypothetical protein